MADQSTPNDGEDRDLLWDHVQMAESIAGILAFNYMGDGSFDEADQAPGVRHMVDAVANLLSQADDLAERLKVRVPEIKHARGFAEHLARQSDEELYTHRGFRIGDQTIGMCYWTIEKLTHRAFWKYTGEHAA